MSGKIFVHVGLPKTATSTLQIDFFPTLSGGNIDYIGVDGLRREQHHTDLYNKFLSAVNSGKGVDELRAMLVPLLSSGKTLILSEEMFTVSEESVSWRKKIANLAKILDGLDYALILTVREPTSALFSYYVELYTRFAKRFASFVECALHDEDMHIYHYKKLTDEIFDHYEPSRVYAFKFEDIIKNDVSGLLSLISPSYGYRIKLSDHNKRLHAKGFVRSRYNITVLDVIRCAVKGLGINNVKSFARLKIIVRPMTMQLDKLVLRNTKIAFPSQEEVDCLKNALREETAALDKHFRIKYG